MNKGQSAIAAAVVLVSAGLASCSLPDADKLDKEATVQISQVIESQKSRWDGQALWQSMDPKTKISADDTESICQLYSSVLGPLKDHGPVTRVNYKSGAGINIPEYVGAYSTSVSCQKAKGTASITLHKRDGKWYLLAFNIDSPAIQEALKTDQEGASDFVDKFVPSLCRSWKYEDVEQTADADLKSQLQSNSVPTKALLAVSSKGLGKLEKYEGARFTNYTSVKGRKVLAFIAKAAFQNGKADIPVTVSSEGNTWKLRSINFNVRPK